MAHVPVVELSELNRNQRLYLQTDVDGKALLRQLTTDLCHFNVLATAAYKVQGGAFYYHKKLSSRVFLKHVTFKSKLY